ncbi:MAG: ferredoxin--NADP reductase [Candidatus Hodgkinia cicadicola]
MLQNCSSVNGLKLMIFDLIKANALAKVLEVKHYTNRLFSFKTSRPDELKFSAGEFVMIGLIIKGNPVFRAYSICSPSWKWELEFYSIRVLNGPFTSFLQKINTNNALIIKVKPTGTLLVRALKPGGRLFLLCTGTGVAPFISMVFEPEVYTKFKEVVLVLTCRKIEDLQYLKCKINQLMRCSEIKALARGKIRFYTSVTREPYTFKGRIPWLLTSGLLVSDLAAPALGAKDRFMVCGSQSMIVDVTAVLKAMGYREGTASKPGAFVYEKAFAV